MAGRDQMWCINTGTTGGFGKRWYVPAAFGGGRSGGAGRGLGSAILSANTLYAARFNAGRGWNLAEVGMWVQAVGSASQFRLGIYADTGFTFDHYPKARLAATGNITVAVTTFCSAALALTLAQNTSYWIVYLVDGINANVSSMTEGGARSVHGKVGDAYRHGLTHTFAYAALPDPFPFSSPVVQDTTATAAAVHCYFSS